MKIRRMSVAVVLCGAVVWAGRPVAAADDLPDAKPIPAVQVIPLPDHQASFQYEGRELTRYHFRPDQRRPFCYPMMGPAGRSLTRMGHPHDPIHHSHHNSVWISHHSVNGVNFWTDHAGDAGRIVHQRVERYGDGDEAAWMVGVNEWRDAAGETVMLERRRLEVRPLGDGEWMMVIDLRLEAPGGEPVTIDENPFGIIGVRMAKTIGVHDGGGRIRNSEGQINEEAVFRKPARWVDYSGPTASEQTGGITLMDHPSNPNHPAPFHVRGDGWMGACLTLDQPIIIEPDQPLRLRYGLWMHAGVPGHEAVEERWEVFEGLEVVGMGEE